MKIVTLCGSMRFAEQMKKIALDLETKHDYCAIPPIDDCGVELSCDDLLSLSRAHFRKIDIADVIYIVNIAGYIGDAVAREIAYAEAHGKSIVYLEPKSR